MLDLYDSRVLTDTLCKGEVWVKVDEVIASSEAHGEFLWLDIIDPSPLELEGISEQYLLPYQAVQDCLESEHLPKFERIGDLNFVIVRSYDESSKDDADTVQELTRKIAVFETNRFVITIHRQEQKFFEDLKNHWRTAVKIGDRCEGNLILLDIVRAAMESYEKPVTVNRELLEDFEIKVFKHQGDTFEDGYFLKRRANTFKRMIRLTIDILPRISEYYKEEASFLQDIKERGDRLLYNAEEFFENINHLVNLHLSLLSHRLTVSSHRQNETMRILTIFSVFFMPLNLITGIYGMNFVNMPELKWENGYFFALGLLLSISISIASVFYFKGYFHRDSSK